MTHKIVRFLLGALLVALPALAEQGSPKLRTAASDTASRSKYRFSTFLGMEAVRSLGWGIGLQFAYSPRRESPWHFGGEAHYTLFSPGSLLGTLAGAWYDTDISGAPSLGLSAGLLGGFAFTSGLPQINTMATAAFLDCAITQRIDELVTVRGQVRPGLVGNYFSFMMNLALSFRFI